MNALNKSTRGRKNAGGDHKLWQGYRGATKYTRYWLMLKVQANASVSLTTSFETC